jgi:hypothetical protein
VLNPNEQGGEAERFDQQGSRGHTPWALSSEEDGILWWPLSGFGCDFCEALLGGKAVFGPDVMVAGLSMAAGGAIFSQMRQHQILICGAAALCPGCRLSVPPGSSGPLLQMSAIFIAFCEDAWWYL